MDLSRIQQKLKDLSQEQGRNREKVDYEKVFWRPTIGENRIRIVPSVYDPSYPFTELLFYYNVGRFPMIAPTNFGKQDPIDEFIKELKKTNDSDNWSLAGKLTPRVRTFAPVIVRGEEEQGVRLWGFSKTIYQALLALAKDEDIGDYTDPVTGFDLMVEQMKGDPYPTTTVRIKPKQTPLSEDAEQVRLWLNEQPDPKEVYTEYDYDFMKKQLETYLGGGEEDESSASSTETVKTPQKEEKTATPLSFEGMKQDLDSNPFDDLFGDDD